MISSDTNCLTDPGLSVDEIAQRLNLSPEQVAQVLNS